MFAELPVASPAEPRQLTKAELAVQYEDSTVEVTVKTDPTALKKFKGSLLRGPLYVHATSQILTRH